ncbi:hypothetical protein MMC06_004621 [Schaereria dolodes]|nr:hypothetical protein [Schaereria dolodes]
MADAADLLSELLTMLAAPSSQNSALTNTAINAAVLAYEKKMLPRAFSWVKASGGTGGPLPDPSGWKGTMGIYVANRVFDLMSLPGMVVKMLLG